MCSAGYRADYVQRHGVAKSLREMMKQEGE
jgi:hypothetical protein